ILRSLSLPPLECCFGTKPIQAEKLRPDRKAPGSATFATRAVASNGPRPGIVKPSARFIRPVAGHDHSIEFQNLLLEAEQLSAQCVKTCTHDVRHPFVVSVGNDTEQSLDTFTSNGCNDA